MVAHNTASTESDGESDNKMQIELKQCKTNTYNHNEYKQQIVGNL